MPPFDSGSMKAGPHRARRYTRPVQQPDTAPSVLEVDASTFNPTDWNIEQVKEFLGAHPGMRDDVIAAEEDGQNRVTLLEWLYAQPDGEEPEDGDEETDEGDSDPEDEPEGSDS